MSALINTDKEYLEWVKDVVARYRQSQIKAAVKVNRELLAFYWSLGKDIVELKAESKWGEKFYKSLSADLCAKLPDVHSFSETSLKYIKYFYSTYSQLITIRPQLEDELKTTLFSIPWGRQYSRKQAMKLSVASGKTPDFRKQAMKLSVASGKTPDFRKQRGKEGKDISLCLSNYQSPPDCSGDPQYPPGRLQA